MTLPEDRARSIPLPPPSILRFSGAGADVGASQAVSERRRFHRVTIVHGPSVRIEVRKPDGTRLHGIVEDCCWTGAAARFGYASDPNIRVNQVGVVIVTSLRLPELTLRARVATAEPLQTGGTRYGLQFVDEDELHRQVTPEWRRWFSRRRHPRFEPRGECAAAVTVTWNGGQARGRVADASTSGIGVDLDVESARAAVVAREVGVLLTFPGSGGTMRLRATVRGAKQGLPSVRVGLELTRDEAYEACKPRMDSWAERMRLQARASEQPRGPAF